MSGLLLWQECTPGYGFGNGGNRSFQSRDRPGAGLVSGVSLGWCVMAAQFAGVFLWRSRRRRLSFLAWRFRLYGCFVGDFEGDLLPHLDSFRRVVGGRPVGVMARGQVSPAFFIQLCITAGLMPSTAAPLSTVASPWADQIERARLFLLSGGGDGGCGP